MTIDDLTADGVVIHDLRIAGRRNGENLIRLAMEWLVRSASDEEFDLIVSLIEPEDLRPLLERAYEVVWGPMPAGPVPRIALLTMPRDRDANPHEVWAAWRERIYGGADASLEHLRALAARPELVDGRGLPFDGRLE